jgi:L-asparaginase / beta-aspartyl-peptidase
LKSDNTFLKSDDTFLKSDDTPLKSSDTTTNLYDSVLLENSTSDFSFVQGEIHFTFESPLYGRSVGRCLVHGGAWDIPDQMRAPHRSGVDAAFHKVRESLHAGSSALDSLVAGLCSLEDDPTFDAGFGSFLNEHGGVELDAGVMEGAELKAGAVASLGAFPNPSRVALEVLKSTEHVLLVGEGATAFALKKGFAQIKSTDLVHPREIEAHKRWIAAGKPSAKVYFSSQSSGSTAGDFPEKRGTVGIVLSVTPQGAQRSLLFAGTSTGGTPGKMLGRVGDVPMPGAGFYADENGAAVSATGWGEALLRSVACKRISDLCSDGFGPQEACERVLKEMYQRTGGQGGFVAITSQGSWGSAFSTPDMAVRAPAVVKLKFSKF